MRIVSVGHAFFAATMIAIGIMGLLSGHFAPIWAGVPKETPAREVLMYASATISLASGIALLFRPTAVIASLVLFVALLVHMAAFRVTVILKDPLIVVAYESAAEAAVVVAGALALFARLAADLRLPGSGASGVNVARAIFGLSMVVFGVAHFAYLDLTASLVPNWIPSHAEAAAATGVTYMLAGAAILTGFMARLAAALVTLQIALFTLLIWVPVVMTGHPDAGQWTEFVVSWALTASALLVAESYRGAPWIGSLPESTSH